MKPTDTEKAERGAMFARARQAAGITQTELAHELGVKPQSVQQYESGKTTPRGYRLKRLRELIGPAIDEIFLGAPMGAATTNALQASETTPASRVIPLIDWDAIADGAVEEFGKRARSWRAENKVGARSFAMIVPGESMASGPLPIVAGAIIVVDPDISIEAPSATMPIVVAVTSDGDTLLRQVTRDGSKLYLKANSAGYPIIPLDENCRVLGVVRRIAFDL